MSDSQTTPLRLIGVEVSATGLNSVCIDPSGLVVAAAAERLDRASDLVPQLASHVNSLKATFGEFSKVGVAVPGLVNRRTNRVEYSAEFPEASKVDIAAEIKAAVNADCTVENDANSAAFGEFRVGAGRGAENMFYATLGSGIGGAFIFDGKIWRGSSGYAGEFGYVAINSDGMRLEDVASSANIVRRTRSRFHQDSTSILSRFEEEAISISDIVDAAEKQDDFAILMLERTGVYVGSAIASVINLLNVERIVLGGEIMEAGPSILDAITRRARELSFGPSFANTTISAGILGSNAAAIGVALLTGAE